MADEASSDVATEVRETIEPTNDGAIPSESLDDRMNSTPRRIDGNLDVISVANEMPTTSVEANSVHGTAISGVGRVRCVGTGRKKSSREPDEESDDDDDDDDDAIVDGPSPRRLRDRKFSKPAKSIEQRVTYERAARKEPRAQFVEKARATRSVNQAAEPLARLAASTKRVAATEPVARKEPREQFVEKRKEARKGDDKNKRALAAALEQFHRRCFIGSDVFELFLGVYRMKERATKNPRNPSLAALRRLLVLAHSARPSLAFGGQSAKSRSKLEVLRYARSLYYRKVELLMRTIALVRESDISQHELMHILAPTNDAVFRGWAVITPTAIRRTIVCSLNNIPDSRRSTKISASAQLALRLICDLLAGKLIRQVQRHQMSNGAVQRLLPQHFISADLESRYALDIVVQSVADPVSESTYLSKCDDEARRGSRKVGKRELPYELSSLRNIVKLEGLMSLQRPRECLKYINAKVFEALTRIIAYGIAMSRMKGSESRNKTSVKTKMLMGEHVTRAADQLYGLRVVDIQKAAEYEKASRERRSMLAEFIDAAALDHTLRMHSRLNYAMLNNMVNEKVRRQLRQYLKRPPLPKTIYDKDVSIDRIR